VSQGLLGEPPFERERDDRPTMIDRCL